MRLKNLLATFTLLLAATFLPGPAWSGQYLMFSEQCKQGDHEAQNLFKQAQDYRFGRGVTMNMKFAVFRYAEAIIHGSSRALYDMGTISEEKLRWSPNSEGIKEEALSYFRQAADGGCPEGLYKLYLWDEYNKEGLSQEFPSPLLLEAAEKGALIAMCDLGNQYLQHNQRDEGEKWFKKALDLGYGDAAIPYYRLLLERGNTREALNALFSGAKAGSLQALKRLAWIFSRGRYKQMQDFAYTDCLLGVANKILPEAPPEPIPDLDKLCPPPRIMGY